MKLNVYNDGSDKAYVFGHQFGPVFVAITDSLEEAINRWDEDHGHRVDIENDAAALADYGDDTESAIDRAAVSGDTRINDSGTVVWVDHCEWVREFDTIGEAFAFAFGITQTD